MYSIYDKKGRVYEPPRYCINEQTAQRQFQIIFENVKSMYNRFPTDYEIYFVGTYCDDRAEFTHIGTPCFKWNGGEVIKERDVNRQQTMFNQQNPFPIQDVQQGIKEVKTSKNYQEAKKNAEQKG